MCRMMSVVTKDNVKPEWLIAFHALASKGKLRCDMNPAQPGHGDGWGMVCYAKEAFPMYLDRQPHSAADDAQHYKNDAQFLGGQNAHAAMVHFRKISVGQPAISNTHPFTFKQWAFCHNGTIYESDSIPLKGLKPYGATDSERFFLFLIEHLNAARVNPNDAQAVAGALKGGIEELKKTFKYSSLTFLLTDGKILYAYRESGEPQFDDYYTLYRANVPGGSIVASEPLPSVNSHWDPLPNGTLLTLSA